MLAGCVFYVISVLEICFSVFCVLEMNLFVSLFIDLFFYRYCVLKLWDCYGRVLVKEDLGVIECGIE